MIIRIFGDGAYFSNDTVGEKIVADDKAMAGQFDKNAANGRFK